MSLEYLQESFLGGINQQFDPTRIGKNEYMLAVNVRNRRDTLEPIKLPLDITSAKPDGKIQGIYGASNLLVLFVEGKAYFKDFLQSAGSIAFTRIGDFSMSAEVDTIYAEFVPSSSLNYSRGKNPVTTNLVNPVVLGENAAGFTISPASVPGLVVQDGISQPWLITPAGTRKLHTYDQWALPEDREYVPVGKQMLYSGGVLWIVAPNGQEIYRSVKGRPLDFTIAIDGIEGNKSGKADTTSIKPDYNPITTIREVSAGDSGGFFVGTRPISRYIIPGVDALLFGQPLNFTYQYLFPIGPVNHFSTVDLSGDTAFITDSGVRSFNGTSILKYESNNDPLSTKVYQLFDGVTQTSPCACNFDNYAFFAVQTKYGPGVLVYDTLSKSFCSLDLYPDIGQIKQFAVVQYNNTKRLFFYTEDNKLYEAFASPITAQAQLYIGEWATGNPSTEQKGGILQLVMTDAKESGTITATIFVDRKIGASSSKQIDKSVTIQEPPITIPFGASTEDTVQETTFSDLEAKAGWKIGYLVTWNCQASLSHIRVTADAQTGVVVNQDEAAKQYES
jgi:hypothetical protein